VIGLPPGVTAGSEVELNPSLSFFLQRLRAAVPDVPIHVNSGYRSPQAQARAMLAKVQMGENLSALYGAKAQALLRLPLDPRVWTAAIEALRRRGIYMSPHMRGDALDLRTRDLSPSQVAQLANAAARLGGRPLLESTPPHLHIDGIAAGTVRSFQGVQTATSEDGNGLPVILLALGAALLLGPAAAAAAPGLSRLLPLSLLR